MECVWFCGSAFIKLNLACFLGLASATEPPGWHTDPSGSPSPGSEKCLGLPDQREARTFRHLSYGELGSVTLLPNPGCFD